MEKQTKHRILGAVVVIALVIISMPLFHRGKELPSEKVIVQAPPFPDQTVEVAATPDAFDENPSQENRISVTKPNVIPATQALEPNDTNKDPKNDPDKHPAEHKKAKPSELPPALTEEAPKTHAQLTENAPRPVKDQRKASSSLGKVKNRLATALKANIDKDGLINLKNPTWVIQLGSFKNKTNALRLVNQLRTNPNAKV